MHAINAGLHQRLRAYRALAVLLPWSCPRGPLFPQHKGTSVMLFIFASSLLTCVRCLLCLPLTPLNWPNFSQAYTGCSNACRRTMDASTHNKCATFTSARVHYARSMFVCDAYARTNQGVCVCVCVCVCFPRELSVMWWWQVSSLPPPPRGLQPRSNGAVA